MKNNEKILLSVLSGIAVGAVLGILIAPDKGPETRKKSKRKAENSIDDLQEQIEQGKKTIEELKAKLSGKADKILKTAVTEIEQQLK